MDDMNTFLDSVHFLFLPAEPAYLGQTNRTKKRTEGIYLTLFVGLAMPIFAENAAISYTR